MLSRLAAGTACNGRWRQVIFFNKDYGLGGVAFYPPALLPLPPTVPSTTSSRTRLPMFLPALRSVRFGSYSFPSGCAKAIPTTSAKEA